MVSVDIILFVDIYLDGTNIRVGSISIVIILDISVRIIGNRLTGNAVFRTLQLSDRLGTLGLDQDAFNNLANLARDTLTKVLSLFSLLLHLSSFLYDNDKYLIKWNFSGNK